MKLQECISGQLAGCLSGIDKQKLVSRLLIRTQPAKPIDTVTTQTLFDAEIDPEARITAVGVGAMGAGMVRKLYSDMSSITCHEVVFDSMCERQNQMPELIASIQEADLLFVLTAFEDEGCGAVVENIGWSAREAGVLVLALIPDTANCQLLGLAELRTSVDAVFAFSEESLSDKRLSDHIQYSNPMLHMIMVITLLINQRSFISVDFVDIAAIMRKGNSGRLGIGMASRPDQSGEAATIALEQLVSQGVSMSEIQGALVILEGSSQITIDNYSNVNRVIHGHVAEDAKIIVGFVMDDRLGDNVRVSAFCKF